MTFYVPHSRVFYLLLIFVVLRTIKGLCRVNFDSFIRRHKNSLILGIWYQLIIESITSRCSVLHQLQYLWIFWTLSDNWDTLSRIVFLFLFYFPFTLLFCHSSTFLRWANVRYRKMKNRPNFLQSVARHTVILVMNLETNFPSPLVNAGMGKINRLKNTEHWANRGVSTKLY